MLTFFVVPAAFYLFERKRVAMMEGQHALVEADGDEQQQRVGPDGHKLPGKNALGRLRARSDSLAAY